MAFNHLASKISCLKKIFISPESFLAKFGADPSQLESLVAAKTVTIPRLLEIAPQGTLDPSPFIYNSTLYTMVRLVRMIDDVRLNPFLEC